MGSYFNFGRDPLELEKLNNLKHIALIGAGTMGYGICIDLLNKTECQIDLIDVSDKALARARREIENYFTEEVKQGRLWSNHYDELLERVHYTQEYSALARAQIIWEVATEDVVIKKKIFELIEKEAKREELLFVFSNTSSHTTAELALLFKEQWFREHFLTGHGYYPFHANRLFDVMKGKFASEEVFQMGVAFSEQILEKKTIALREDHHGYITDPIFQAMGAQLCWDVQSSSDLVERALVFKMLTANPFEVLDQTGHMPFTKSAIHLGKNLPASDRLRLLYNQGGRHYPEWLEELEKSGRIGLNSPNQEGFFKWQEGRPVAAFDPTSRKYLPLTEINWSKYWSIQEAQSLDRRNDTIKSIEGLIAVSTASDEGGRSFRRYVIPLMLYAMDLIQDGFGQPSDVNASTKVGLRFKYGLCEIIDGFICHLGLDGFIALVQRAYSENPDRSELYALKSEGRTHLLYTMKKSGWNSLLGYGRIYQTPVTSRNMTNGEMEIYYNDLRLVAPTAKDRVATIIFDNPMRGNVWNSVVLDQLDHAIGLCVDWHERGELGAMLFTAAGKNMRMLGADARQFNRGWFDPKVGYQFLGEEGASYMTKASMALLRYLQELPIWTVGAFGEKWGGGAEFSYFLNQRFDLIVRGVEYDSLQKTSIYREKKNYNQPEIEYAILGGMGAVQELRRLGLGDSLIDEIFTQGLTATRAHQLGLSNGISESPRDLLRLAFEVARRNQKYAAPYSMALYHEQKRSAFHEGLTDEKLIAQTGETFNPAKNPYITNGLLRLLNRGQKNPAMDLRVQGTQPHPKQIYNELRFHYRTQQEEVESPSVMSTGTQIPATNLTATQLATTKPGTHQESPKGAVSQHH